MCAIQLMRLASLVIAVTCAVLCVVAAFSDQYGPAAVFGGCAAVSVFVVVVVCPDLRNFQAEVDELRRHNREFRGK